MINVINKTKSVLTALCVIFLLVCFGFSGSASVGDMSDNFELRMESGMDLSASDNELKLEFRKKREGLARIGGWFKDLVVDEYKDVNYSARVKDNDEIEVEVLKDKKGLIRTRIKNKKKLKPGKHTIIISARSNDLIGEETVELTQDFTWGVLAFNLNKSIYVSGDEAYLQFGVLDDDGNTICDASLQLTIKNEKLKINDVLSTENGDISYSGKCNGNNVTDTPDYYTYYRLDEVGEYELELRAITLNDERMINEKIEVRESVPFEIERIGPTRIYPMADYDMKIVIKANEDYAGDIVEVVPDSFNLKNIEITKIQDTSNKQFPISNFQFPNENNSLIIKNVELEKNDEVLIKYLFDAPNVSPEFYTFGPLRVGEFEELREWQIASDADNEIDHTFVEDVTNYSNTLNYDTDGWLEMSDYTIDSSSFTAGDKYLIAISMSIQNGTSNNYNSMARVRHGTTEFSDSVWTWENRRNAAQHLGHGFQYFTVWEAVSGEDIIVDISALGSTDNNIRTGSYQAMAINLTEDLTEDTDWYYATSTDSGNLPTSWDTTGGASITIDGNGEDWMILGQGYFLIDDTVTNDLYMRLYNATDAVAYNQIRYEGEDNRDSRALMLMSGVNVDSTETWRVEAQVTGASHDWTDSKIFALNLDLFSTHYIDYDTTSLPLTALDTWYDMATTTYDVYNSGDHLIWSQETVDAPVNTPSVQSRITVDSSVVPSGHGINNKGLPHGTTDETAHHNIYLGNMNSGDRSIAAQLYEDQDNSPTSFVDVHNLIVFSMALKAPPTGSFNSALQKTDGSGVIDVSIEVFDPDKDDARAKIEYSTSTDCTSGYFEDVTLSEIDVDTSADDGDPDTENDNEYQIGTTSAPITSSAGSNTVLFDWLSKSQEPSANKETYCLRLTANDWVQGDQNPLATTTLTIDNSAPTVSSVITENLSYAVGDTLTATVTVSNDIDILSLSAGSTINNKTLTNPIKVNNTTYTFDYVVAEGDIGRTLGSIPYDIALVDALGNQSATSSANFSNGSIDANSPSISSVVISDLLYAIGDTATATITVSSDTDTYTLGISTINSVTVTNLIKENDTTYTVNISITEGDTNRASGTIPYSIVLIDSYQNANTAYTGNFVDGSIDADRPTIQAVYITNDDYKISSDVVLIIDTTESGLYIDAVSTVNNKSVHSLVDNADTTYNVTYTVTEGDTDRGSNEIPASIVMMDRHGNTSATYDTPANNVATVDANRPEILSIEIPNLNYKIGDTLTATVTVTADPAVYSLGTSSINFATSVTDNLIKIDNSTYTVDYTIEAGNTDRGANQTPAHIQLTDQVGHYNQIPFTTVSANSATIDATRPVVTGVTFNPSSGVLIVGQKATATISALNNETGLSIVTATINNVDVVGTFNEIGSGNYELVYTIAEGHTDHPDNDDIPVYFVVRDTSGNDSEVYASSDPDNRPGVDANTSAIESVTFEPSSGTLTVGSVATATIKEVSLESGLATGTAMTINGVDVSDTFTASTTAGYYLLTYTVTEGDTDIDDTTEDLAVVFSLLDSAGNESPIFNTADIVNRPGVDAQTPVISSVVFEPSSGTLIVGETATATIEITGFETGLLAGNTMTINGEDVSSTFVSSTTAGYYLVSYTVTEGDNDIDDLANLPISLSVQDDAGNEATAFIASDVANRPGVDANTPVISTVVFEPTSGLLKVGDIATATISITGAESGLLAGSAMTINSIDVSSTFDDLLDGTYTVTYTVQEGHNDINDIADLPIYFFMRDTAGNESNVFDTSDAANRPGVDANTPGISDVTFVPSSGTLKVGDKATATIQAIGLESGLASGTSMTINGVDVSDAFVASSTAGYYLVSYTVTEGDNDILDSANLPIVMTLRDFAYNETATYNTADIGGRPGVDGNTPVITNVTFNITSGLLRVGDTATATIVSDETGYSANTIIINGVDVSGTLASAVGNNYTVTYTVAEGHTDIPDANDLPINISLADNAGNISSSYTTASAGTRPGVDANTPSAPGDLSFVSHTNTSITILFGATSTESNFYDYKIYYKQGTSGVNENDSVWDSSNDTDLGDQDFNFTTSTTITNLATGTDYAFNIWVYDVASNTAFASGELQASTNKAPAAPSSLLQKENDNVTTVANGEWAIDQTVILSSTSTDPELQFVDFYYEVLNVASTSRTATTVPATSCSSGNSFNDCTGKIWKYSTGPDWYDTDWKYRKQITIDADLVVDDETDFPLLSSSIDEDLKREARSDGYDIIFTEDDGVTPLNFERKFWDSSTGQLISWIKTDLSSSTDNVIFMYYGNSTHSTDLSTTTGVWDSSYVGVWHMDEEPTGSTDDIKDSSSGAHHMTSNGMGAANRIQTDTGYAYEFDGNLDYLEDADGENYINGLDEFTVELWLKSDVIASDRGFIIGAVPNGGDNYFTLRYDEAGANQGNAYHNLVKGAITTDISGELQFESSEYVQTTQWQHLVFRWQSGSQYEVFVNGSFDTPTFNSPAGTDVTEGADRLRIGQGGKDATAGWDGMIDEVRISNVYRTDAFVQTAYNNQSNLNSFALFGAQDAVRIYNLPESSEGYKWQVMACDELNNCSEWVPFNASTPNFKVDNTVPTVPGNLTEDSHDSTSVTLTFGASSTESFFDEYRIYYKEYDGTPVSTSDSMFDSGDDFNLGDILYNDASTTTIPFLTAGVQYEFNIWAFDLSEQSASGTPITVTTSVSSNAPTGSFNTVATSTDGSGRIDISIEIDDVDNDPSRAKIEYVAGAGCNFASPLDPTIDTTNVTSDNVPFPAIDNDHPYQVGTTSAYILTSPFSNTVNIDWNSKTDVPAANGTYCLRLTANDGTADQAVPTTQTVVLDNVNPAVPGNLSVLSTTTNTVKLAFGADSSDTHFERYYIYYKAGLSSVTINDTEYSDSDLLVVDFNNSASTTLSGLSAGTDYVVNIWAYDSYGNRATATEQVFKTNAYPSAPSNFTQLRSDGLTVIPNNSWTNENTFRLETDILDADESELISVYFEIASTSNLFNNSTSSACAFNASWQSCNSKVWKVISSVGDYDSIPFTATVIPSGVPDEYAGLKWQVMACDKHEACTTWTDAGADPNIKIDSTLPQAPGALSLYSYDSSSINLGFGAAASDANFLEYIVYYQAGITGVDENDTVHSSTTDANLDEEDYSTAAYTTVSGLSEGQDYVFEIYAYDEAGNKASSTFEFTTPTNNRPSLALVATSTNKDGSGVVNISFSVDDADDDDSRARIDYVAGSCDFSTPLDPTLDESDGNATSTYGDAKIENDNTYQAGNASGWIETASGANTVYLDWLSQSDLPASEGKYCIRVTANDNIEDAPSVATSTVIIDNIDPTTPGSLTQSEIHSDEIIISFGATSTDTNFTRYRLFYKEGVTAVTEDDIEHIDPNLLDQDFNFTSTTSISGLSAGTQYSFRIFAYDSFGNISASTQANYTTNGLPTGSFNSATQAVDGSGELTVSMDIYDADSDDCTVRIDYVAGATCNFSTPLDPTLDESPFNITADYDTPGIMNSQVFQIGTSSPVKTYAGANTIGFIWNTRQDIPGANGDYCLQLTVSDGTDFSATSTLVVAVDNTDPVAPTPLTVDSVTGMAVKLNLETPSGTDDNFKEYKIFYKEGTSGVSETDSEYNKDNEAALGNEDYNSVASTTITGLKQSTDYVFNIWIYDDFGNVASSASEVSTTTLFIPSATWREDEDVSLPTVSDYVSVLENVRLRIAVANTGDYDALGYRFNLEYGAKNGTCAAVDPWIPVPLTATTEHFELISSIFFDNAASTTEKLSNDGYTFIPGYLLEEPSIESGNIAFAGGEYTEIEFALEPTANIIPSATYCFRLTDESVALDSYSTYAELTMAPPPVAYFNTFEQRKDGSGIVDISIDVGDETGADTRAKLEYVSGLTCDFSIPLSPTLDETGANISATHGTVIIDNNSSYQIGTSSGWIDTSYGTNTVQFDWQSMTDLIGQDGTYCLRVTANDSYTDQLNSATTTLTIDNDTPSAPGNLNVYTKTLTSVTLQFGATSSDANFYEYRIYYKQGSSGVTESDSLHSSSTDPNLAYADFQEASTTQISGLESGKEYVFKIWAYDKYGNKVSSVGEVSTKLVPSMSGIVYLDDGITPLLTSPTVSIVVDGVLKDSVSASALDGRFTFSEINPPATGTPIMVYVNNSDVKGATYNRFGNTGELNDLHIYLNRVVVRHDDDGPISTVDIDAYDSDQDSDVPCTVTGVSLSLPAGVEIQVWTGSTFESGSGSLDLDDVVIDGEWTAIGEQTITVEGYWDAKNGSFSAASSTVEFISTTTESIWTNNSAFYSVNFNGTSGEWIVYSNASSTATTTISQGTMVQGANVNYETDSFVIESGATFTKASGTGIFIFEDDGEGEFNDKNAIKNNLGNVQIGYSPAVTKLNSDFVADSLTVNSGDSFDTRGYEVDITNFITVNGTYDCTDDKEGDGTITSLGTNWTLAPGATFTADNSTTTFDGSSASIINTGGSDGNHDFYHLTIEKTSTATATLAGYSLAVSGDIEISSASGLDVSTSNYQILAGGSWLNSGQFEARNGTTTFNAVSSGHTINVGSNTFYNLSFDSASGGWTLIGAATTTNDFYIENVASLDFDPGLFIEVQGQFVNQVGGVSTDWNDAILYLHNTDSYSINSKVSGGDYYPNLLIGANSDIRMWNSSSSNYIVDSSASLYSQDHSGVDGDLYIWNDYHIGVSRTENWSYNTDFDGTDISGLPRQANIRLISNAQITMDGGNLYIDGVNTATTTIDNQGSGNYGIDILVGNFRANYFSIRNIDLFGLSFANTPNIESLNYGDMELAVDGGTLISVNATVVSANPLASSTGMRFATTTAISGTNVDLTGSPSSAWIFTAHYGNLAGDNFDSDPGDPRGYIIWDDSPVFNPKSQDWRWYYDEENATPLTPAAAVNFAPSSIGPNNYLKLRMTINEVDGISGNNTNYRLQYSLQPDFSNDTNYVGEIGSSTAHWNYTDGGGVDKAIISSRVLSDSTNNGYYNESNESYTGFDHSLSTAYEFEYTLRRNSSAVDDSVYYFRAVVDYYDTTLRATTTKVVQYNSGEAYPSLMAASGTLSFIISGVNSGTVIDSITTDFDTSVNQVPFGEVGIGTEREGAHRFNITTNSEYGYQLFTFQRQNLISSHGDEIVPITTTNDSPGAWSISSNPSGFGYHTSDDTLSGGDPSRFSFDNSYARFQSSFEEISYSPIPVANETVDFIYKLEVADMQEAGNYETEVIYVVVPTY